MVNAPGPHMSRIRGLVGASQLGIRPNRNLRRAALDLLGVYVGFNLVALSTALVWTWHSDDPGLCITELPSTHTVVFIDCDAR
jgi:hypothetical protein